jgi:hypothetical protein
VDLCLLDLESSVFLLLSVAAANLLTLPVLQAGTLKPAFKAQMNEGGAAAVKVRLVVSPAGVPIHCTSPFSNGPAANVEAFCSMLQTSTRYVPARDSLGRLAYGTIQLWSQWSRGKWQGSAQPQWNPADLTLETNRMPKGFAQGSVFQLILQVNATGKVESCAVATAKVPDQAKDLLCREASAVTIPTATDEQGKSVPSVQEFFVRLTPKPYVDKVMKHLCDIDPRC